MRRCLHLILLALILSSCEQNKVQQHVNHRKFNNQYNIDSLEVKLLKVKDDTSKVLLLNDLSLAYSTTVFDKTMQYAQEALMLAEQLKWKEGVALSTQSVGISYMVKSDYLNSKKYLELALNLYKNLDHPVGVAYTILKLGELSYNQAEYSNALDYYFKAMKHFEELSDQNGKAIVIGKIGIVYFYLYDPNALSYLTKSLKMNEALGNKSAVAENLRFIGNVYTNRKSDYKKALSYYYKAIKLESELGNRVNVARNLINMGIAYGYLFDRLKDLKYKLAALKIYKELNEKSGLANAYGNLGWTYFAIGIDTGKVLNPAFKKYGVYKKRDALLKAKTYMDSSSKIFNDIGELDHETFYVVSKVDSILGNFESAYNNYRQSIATKELMFSREKTKKVAQLELNYEYAKKEIEAKAEQDRKLLIQRNIRNSVIAGFIIAIVFLIVVYRQRNRISIEKKRSDHLLLNILPTEVAEELKSKGTAEARQFDEVTVLFTDFKNFTKISERLSAKELVEEIHTCFKAFDEITEKYGIEKIKTIGDSYMCVGGLPIVNNTHAEDVVNAGIEIQLFINQRMQDKIAQGEEPFQVRIGIHTGPVVAGIVGIKKFAYDIWGDTVNTASRIESSGEVGKVNISETTYRLVKDKFHCTPRGKISAKNKGELEMWFVSS